MNECGFVIMKLFIKTVKGPDLAYWATVCPIS